MFAIVALIDADDEHHEKLISLYEERPADWILPWAILPEVDYLLSAHVGDKAQRVFLADLATGSFSVECGSQLDLLRARKICEQYRSLKLGLVDATVMAVAERLKARAIATLDVRDFDAVRIIGSPKLLPRDA
jgi:predicted nucleic acid-binding protein